MASACGQSRVVMILAVIMLRKKMKRTDGAMEGIAINQN
jgi:hypothetical protein